MTGDIFGKCTSHNWNGSSVVDLCISSNDLFDRIANFTVEPYTPWLSDHCMINTTINVSGNFRCSIEQMTPIQVHPGWVWNDVAREIFEKNLASPYYRDKINALLSDVNLSPVELAKNIELLLLENTKTSCLKEKKTVNKDSRKSQPWFDSECSVKKNEINKLGHAVRKCPLDNLARTDLNNAKKCFKRTI